MRPSGTSASKYGLEQPWQGRSPRTRSRIAHAHRANRQDSWSRDHGRRGTVCAHVRLRTRESCTLVCSWALLPSPDTPWNRRREWNSRICSDALQLVSAASSCSAVVKPFARPGQSVVSGAAGSGGSWWIRPMGSLGLCVHRLHHQQARQGQLWGFSVFMVRCGRVYRVHPSSCACRAPEMFSRGPYLCV